MAVNQDLHDLSYRGIVPRHHPCRTKSCHIPGQAVFLEKPVSKLLLPLLDHALETAIFIARGLGSSDTLKIVQISSDVSKTRSA